MPATERSPGFKLGMAILVGLMLSIPLFTVWLLVYDRQLQSEQAQQSIAEGWGGPQLMAGPVLVIPYRTTANETATENGQQVTRSREVWQELSLAPEQAQLDTEVRPERRARSIYEVVVYDSRVSGRARFAMPADLQATGVDPATLDLGRAELRFGLSDPRGLGANPRIAIGGQQLRLQPGGGTPATGGRGFFARLDAAALARQPILVDFAYDFRGNGSLGLAPHAGDTLWRVRSAWPHPAFRAASCPPSAMSTPRLHRHLPGRQSRPRPLVSRQDPRESASPQPAEMYDTQQDRSAGPASQAAQITSSSRRSLFAVNRRRNTASCSSASPSSPS